jgi:hypothetical protein
MHISKTKIYITLTISITAIVLIVSAMPNTSHVPATNNKSGIPVIIPKHAIEISDGVFSLGHSIDIDGKVVEGFMFIRSNKDYMPKKEKAKPPWAGNGKDKGGDTTCYAFMAKGAKWKTTEQYITGTGIDTTLTEISLNIWDDEIAFDIFGSRDIYGFTDGADSISPDGKNEVEFIYLGEGNTIAVTTVWGIFSGPPKNRELVEWDTEFNTAYPFGDAELNSNLMDYQNIAVHEFGHSLGLSHPPNTCTEETMYAFSNFGETKKRDLNTGDIAGVNDLYV